MRRVGILCLVSLAFIVTGCGKNNQSQSFYADTTTCPGQKPPDTTYAPPKIIVDNEGIRRMDSSYIPQCLYVKWKWTPGGFHWKTHTAQIGIYQLVTTTTRP